MKGGRPGRRADRSRVFHDRGDPFGKIKFQFDVLIFFHFLFRVPIEEGIPNPVGKFFSREPSIEEAFDCVIIGHRIWTVRSPFTSRGPGSGIRVLKIQ